jgi:hypothetical protein
LPAARRKILVPGKLSREQSNAMNTNRHPTPASLKGLGLCVLVAALVAGALPATTAYTQGDSPLPTPPPPTAEPAPPPTPTPTPEPTVAPTPTPRLTRTLPLPRLITKRFQEKDAAKQYEINLRYLVVDKPSDAWAPFNAIAEAQVAEVIASFKQDLAAMGVITAAASPTSTLSSNWERFRLTRDFISVRLTYSVYMAGAAHPVPFTRVINFDPRTGTNLALAELFKPGADYLGAISTYCKRVLERRGVLTFPEGVEPKPENYANWNIGRNNLVIRFDVYQVAPYAAGPQECQMPLSQLRGLLAEPRRW